jgi:hypothetical protein
VVKLVCLERFRVIVARGAATFLRGAATFLRASEMFAFLPTRSVRNCFPNNAPYRY